MIWLRKRLGDPEDGFTLIELMVSIVVLAVGVIGLVKSFDGARNLNTVSERTEMMTHVGQRHIERLHDTPFNAVALAAPLPAHAAGHRANEHVCPGTSNYDWDKNGCATTVEPLVTAPAGVTGVASSTAWSDSSGERGTVHTYVTWVDETCTGGCNAAGGRDYKRLTVVVLLNSGKPRSPIVVQGYAYDSERGRVCAPATGGSPQCG